MRTLVIILSLTCGLAFAKENSRRVEAMRAATERIEQTLKSKDARNKSTVLQETWDVLHLSAMSPEGLKPSDDFLHELFNLTDSYMKIDNSGAAMDVFSDYYEKHRKAVNAYVAKKDRKTSSAVIERVLKAEKEYGTATDSEEPATREPSMTR